MNKIFPNKLNLLGETYRIIECSQSELYDGEETVGKCDFDNKKIYIAIDAKQSTPIEILFHELGHYFGDYYEISSGEFFAEGFSRFIVNILNQINFKNDLLKR